MATEAEHSRVPRVFPEHETPPSGAIGILALLVLVVIGYTGFVHVSVNPDAVGTARPVAATTVARVGALTQVTPIVTTVVVDRPVTVVPSTGFAIVTVTAQDGVTVRDQPTTASPAVSHAAVGSDLTVVGSDVLDPSSTSRWIHVRYQGIEGFVRSDLVDTPHTV